MKPVILHSEAIEELDAGVAYYEDQKAGLGLDFLVEVEQALGRIQQNPNLGAVYKVTGLSRYVIQRFPFLVFYAELEDCIWVIAIAHGRRRPDYWRERQIE
ncbi:type II toxin-antitoxin system RelE/ParE family toxin [Candidatus Synechococcus calcipolaris G9]|uniref:Type II toxin-antitoxin system RelE/ParE family toxin n=1 Tax=Candidatus Synechococcus calcipolaris G9 TaxID=1497997 RepID=A0ABT6EVC3_9SYNE|nr:type II toxin-antitoxin system RelE/ParE family toxin [Candidatus Synechococcus calcipolaris]MDG2989762.1 type II toxin-antitoxin system RelE/ParE family toxin [Candidatus Synechococcus calcipolaris G9]